MNPRLRQLLIIAAIGLVVVFNPLTLFGWILVQARWSNTHPQFAEHVASVGWLPASATDISYYKTYSFTAYEFSISEDEFIKWTGKAPVEIDKPITMPRYLSGIRPDASLKEVCVTVGNGLYARTPPRGNGGGTFWMYDRPDHRAYFQHSPR